MMHNLFSWRRKLRPNHAFWTLMGINLCAGVINMVFKLGIFSVLMNVSSVLLILWSLSMLRGINREYYVRLWAWVTGLTAVKIMDYAHNVKYTLVEHQADGTWVGPLNWNFNLGAVRLLPNGHVDSESDCAFCYIWYPVDEDLKTHLQLTYWEYWPDWHAWLQKSHKDMIVYRESLPDSY